MVKKIVLTVAVLAFCVAGRLAAAPRFSPGFTHSIVYSRSGNPPAWTAGMQSFDFDASGTLYVSAENRYIIRDPGGANEVLYDFGAATYGSFLKLDGASPQNVWFGESSYGNIYSVVSNGGAGQTPTSRGTLNNNYGMAVNSGGQIFVSANTTFSFVPPNPGSAEIWYWTGTDWQQIADMGGFSGPIASHSSDDLYYGFTQVPPAQDDLVFFSAAGVQRAIDEHLILPDAGITWTVYAADLNSHLGIAHDGASGDFFSAASQGTVTRITGFGESGPFGCGTSPTVTRCYGGAVYVLCTDWVDYHSTIYRLQPHSNVPLAVMKETNGDQNLYVYNAPAPGEWDYCDLYACNPSAVARDFWMVPFGDTIASMVALNADGAGEKEIAVLKNESGDTNLYIYNAPSPDDWNYWDAMARNPSPRARDLWAVPSGDNILAMAAANIDSSPDGIEELLVLKEENGGDVNLYAYACPAPGDWNYWDAATRNPSPLARDLWSVPRGDDAVAMAGIDTSGDGTKDRLAVVTNGAGDVNLFLWNMPAPLDWTYWDAVARNPSPAARDFWSISSGDSAQSITGLDTGGTAADEIVVLKDVSGDENLYVYNTIVDGDWSYWDAVSRNPSPIARDLWVIPSGNGVVAIGGLE